MRLKMRINRRLCDLNKDYSVEASFVHEIDQDDAEIERKAFEKGWEAVDKEFYDYSKDLFSKLSLDAHEVLREFLEMNDEDQKKFLMEIEEVSNNFYFYSFDGQSLYQEGECIASGGSVAVLDYIATWQQPGALRRVVKAVYDYFKESVDTEVKIKNKFLKIPASEWSDYLTEHRAIRSFSSALNKFTKKEILAHADDDSEEKLLLNLGLVPHNVDGPSYVNCVVGSTIGAQYNDYSKLKDLKDGDIVRMVYTSDLPATHLFELISWRRPHDLVFFARYGGLNPYPSRKLMMENGMDDYRLELLENRKRMVEANVFRTSRYFVARNANRVRADPILEYISKIRKWQVHCGEVKKKNLFSRIYHSDVLSVLEKRLLDLSSDPFFKFKITKKLDCAVSFERGKPLICKRVRLRNAEDTMQLLYDLAVSNGYAVEFENGHWIAI